MFRLKKAEILTLIEEEQARLKRIEERLEQVENEGYGDAEHEIVLKTAESRQLISVRRRTSINRIPALFKSWMGGSISGSRLRFPRSFFGMAVKSVKMQLI